jgi:hypothetical protein
MAKPEPAILVVVIGSLSKMYAKRTATTKPRLVIGETTLASPPTLKALIVENIAKPALKPANDANPTILGAKTNDCFCKICIVIATVSTTSVSTTMKLAGYTLLIPATFQKKFENPKPTRPPIANIIGKLIFCHLSIASSKKLAIPCHINNRTHAK